MSVLLFWKQLGTVVLKKGRTIYDSTFKAFYKLDPAAVEVVYQKIKPYGCTQTHLLWTLHYLKTVSSNDREIATLLNTDSDTLKLHVVNTLHYLNQALPNVWFFYLCFEFIYQDC